MLDFSVTFVITIINIVILTLILRAVLFKPVTKFMAERTRNVENTIEQAEKNRQDAKTLLEQYEKKLAAADAEAETIIKNAREQAAEDAEKIRAGGKADAERIIAAARTQVAAERQAAIAVFRAEAAALVVNAAGRLVRRELAGEEHLRFAREALKDFQAE
jgi:F-type H+-transporting ATPase subunit b